MKKQLLIFVMMLLPMAVSADAVEIDGIYYNLITKGNIAEVTSNPNKYTGSIEIPESVNYNNTTYSVTSIGYRAFYECSVTSVTIPNSVTNIGEEAFNATYDGYSSHSKLTSVTIGNSVTNIGDRAFNYCSRLTSITIPQSVTNIGRDAFHGCGGLQKVIVSDIAAWCAIKFSSSTYYSYYVPYFSNPLYYAKHLYSDENTEIKNLIIPNNVTSIGDYAFLNCESLTSVNIPNSVTIISKDAFINCSGLQKVIVSDIAAWCDIEFVGSGSNPLYYAKHLYGDENTEIKNLVIPNGVRSICNNAFQNCSGLTSVTIGNGVTSIGNYAFQNCSGLTSVAIGNSATSIGDYAFQKCKSLTLVTISNGVTSIGQSAFSGCSSLTSIIIPNSVTSIDQSAFYECSGLTSVTIGNGIKAITGSAFSKCPNLADVTCHAENVPYTDSGAFSDSYIEYATLHVPSVSVNAYKAADPWKNFKSIVATDGPTPETQKCEKPTISYVNGQLKMSCATEGVEYVTDITDTDIKQHYGASISFTATYNISVYAMKTGFDNSEVATATLVWLAGNLNADDVQTEVGAVHALPVLIQSSKGTLTITGAEPEVPINVYDTTGRLVGSAQAAATTTIPTSLCSGSVAIVKIGSKSIKLIVR